MEKNHIFKKILATAAALLLICALSACSLIPLPVPQTTDHATSQTVEEPVQNAQVEDGGKESGEAKPQPVPEKTEEPAATQEAVSSVSESEGKEDTPQAFYGIWVAAFKEEQNAKDTVSKLQFLGYDAVMLVSNEWSNLNKEKWYVVSAGEYATEDAAKQDLSGVKAAGYSDAYIKYTGDWQG